MGKQHNTFISFLELLHVKHTKSFSDKFYGEHPYKGNMFGISQMLSDYGIDNIGIRVEDKAEALNELDAPFLAHAGNYFLTITRIDKDEIEYIWKKERLKISFEQFLRIWSGNALIAYPDENSAEPEYRKNRTEEIVGFIKKSLLGLVTCFFIGFLIFSSQIYTQWGLISSLLINGTGAFICYFLLLKQMHVHSQYSDKICSLFQKEGKCNDVLESEAANFFGFFSWSEFGMGYFIANLIIILFFPVLYPYLAWINVIALPYTIWSIWYQKFRARHWCSLCLLIQCILWLLFFSDLVFGLISQPDITLKNVSLSAALYAIPILTLALLIPHLSKAEKVKQITYELNSLKRESGIFAAYLKTHTFYDTKEASSLIWGNPDAKNRITVVTNPHCNPCAKMHERLEKLLSKTNNGYCIQYILTAFDQELEDSNRLFIDRYQKLDQSGFCQFMKEWYQKLKYNWYEAYHVYPFERDDEKLIAEFNKHDIWIKNTSIRATPTILFNGYELPERYKVEDLIYFVDTDI